MEPWPPLFSAEERHVRLELLSLSHEADLMEATTDGDLSRLWYTIVPSPEGIHAEIGRRLGLLAAGSMLPFAVTTGQAGAPWA